MPTIPVMINNAFKTRVLLDTASTKIFISRNAVATLGELCTLNHVDDQLSEIGYSILIEMIMLHVLLMLLIAHP